ncbi:MAG: SCP2 sterol-binding domain-containing protein [Pseudomonadota bacterium]|nr:MAG: SCP2 sterol-binding domain-containing protein [Pseudomonadota bacterium]
MDPLSLPLALIEAAWNAVIRARPELQAAVTALDGRVVQITLKGLERSFFVLVSEGQLQLQGEWQGEPDAHISGTPLAFMALRAGEEATLFRGEVTIDGDAQLGREFRKLLDQIAEHWEAPWPAWWAKSRLPN